MKKTLAVLLLAGGLCAIAKVHAVEPRQLLEVVDFSHPVLSPSGTMVAFRTERASVARNTYDTFWYVENVDGASPPRRVAEGGVVLRDIAGVSLPIDPVWSPDGRWLYFRASVGGRIDVWRAAVDSSGATALTHDPADVSAFQVVNEGRTLQYSVGATRAEIVAAEQSEYDTGIRIDPTVPLGQGLFRSGRIEGRPTTQRFVHGTLARGSLLADTPDRWKAVDLATGAHRALPALDAADRPGARTDSAESGPAPWKRALSAEGRAAILTRVGKQKDLLQKPGVVLSARSLQERKSIICTAPLCTNKQITAIQWRPHHPEVLFTVTDPEKGGAQSIYRWNVHSGAVYPVVHTHGLVNGGRARSSLCGVSSTALVCVTAAADQPPRLERIDIESGRRQVLFEPNAALAYAMKSTSVSLLRWEGADGQSFTGQFYHAQGTSGSPAPLFVSYYQCAGFVRGGVGDEYPFASLAAHGISALCINEAPYVREPAERYDNGTAAVEGVVRLLHARGEVDCANLGMGGLSFGSEVTVWTAMRTHLLAAASVSSPSLSSTYYTFMAFTGQKLTRVLKSNWGLGSLEETPVRWHLLAPQFHVDSISAPLLLQLSEQEYMFALDYAIPLIGEHMADLYVFPNEPHQKFQPRHKLAVYTRNMDWFRFWLQGFEDKHPSKAAQYAHWRAMRKSEKRKKSPASNACVGAAGG